jgi:methyl-accepting chemotaxis protein
LAENIVSEVEDRLTDLFGDGGEDSSDVEVAPDVEVASDVESVTDFDDVSSDIEDAPTLEEDNDALEESPLKDLKSIVLSIDWEISDEIMSRFLDQVNSLTGIYQGDRIILMFLSLLNSVGKYIKAKKENSDADVVKLLNSSYAALEKSVLTKEITEDEKKKLIITEVNKFKKIREKLGGKPADEPKKDVISPEKEKVSQPEPVLEVEEAVSQPVQEEVTEEPPAVISAAKSKGLGLGSKINLFVLLPLIIVVAAGYVYIRQLTGVTLQIDQTIQTYSGLSIEDARNIVFAVFCGLVIIIGIVASIYVSRLAGTVKYLTDVVENINAGEAVPEIKVTSGDEIGALAEAIGRLRKP